MKGLSDLADSLVDEVRGTFEAKRSCNVAKYRAYGTTPERLLYVGDGRNRWIHVFHPSEREALELCRSCDTSEELFTGSKSFLGGKAPRVRSDESAEGELFVVNITAEYNCLVIIFIIFEVRYAAGIDSGMISMQG